MGEFLTGLDASKKIPGAGRWYHELTRYHWFVLLVAALGWMFDCLDQQLFTLSRQPAMRDLLAESGRNAAEYGGYATAIFLLGWASGGLMFGVLGDRIGRAKTMFLTILLYSLCTGLSAFSRGFWDFALFRFLTGLGVGGEFAVGVALVAEVMPDRARPHALGLLQALSTIGNVSSAVIAIGCAKAGSWLAQWHVLGVTLTPWRAMFLVGILPALLALLIRRRLKEPERWEAVAHEGAVTKQLGSYRELFGDPRWRRRALAGMVLAASGVIGLWGIGFFSPELNRSVFRSYYENQAREHGDAEQDRRFLAALLRQPQEFDKVSQGIQPIDLVGAAPGDKDASAIYTAALALRREGKPANATAVLNFLDEPDPTGERAAETSEQRQRRAEFLSVTSTAKPDLTAEAERIKARGAAISNELTVWASIAMILQNLGAFFGMYMFSHLAERIGRRWTFAICFLGALISTAVAFSCLSATTITIGGRPIFVDVFWLIPLMGFWQLSIFGGYAVYFPELFPTYLRSTGTSFCYNVGRFVAAAGPYTFGQLTHMFRDTAQPVRWAGLCMCSIFLLGILILPFLPETRNQPLPE